MKRKALLLTFGVTAAVGAAFATSLRKTPFEEGYGLDLIEESVHSDGTTRTVVSRFVSAEDFDTVAARLDRTIPRLSVKKAGCRLWTPSDGDVLMSAVPKELAGSGYVLKGAETIMETTSERPLNALQKIAFEMENVFERLGGQPSEMERCE